MIVEDDAFTLDTLKTSLLACGVDVVHAARTGKSAIEYAESNSVDIAVLDYNLGRGPNGVDVSQFLVKIQPNMTFILLSGFLDPELIESTASALPKGSSYLLKHNLREIDMLVEIMKKQFIKMA